MKFDFNYYNPTKIYFGKTALNNLKKELANYGENILLVYGKNSIKKNGLYDKVMEILKESNKKVVELQGIKSNPTYTQMMEGARLVKENNVDLILAVGGGSVIDCSKGIAVSAYSEEDPWQKYWVDCKRVDNKVVPVGSILTMVGTGSEMNGGSVITNEEKMLKNGRVFPANVYPKFSILNPEYTYTVPKNQMVSGIFDTLSHLMEQYFSGDDNNTTDYVIEGVMNALIDNARVAIENPMDYEARSNIMWCATLGLNTVTGLSKEQDWEVHMIEHQVGAYTDCPHGIGLAIVSVPYYRYIYKYGLDKFVRFAKKVWKIHGKDMSKDEIALAGIEKLSDFIKELGIPTTLREIGATEEMLPLIANSTEIMDSGYKKLTADEILEILKKAY
ncbi:iron-containing alcohol dehydrogenase [Fusobacterium perfoetens]|uniref:iron-containing alcohol dehydrogenase n=1 Tax=Fusobacterium perfoetens TaxID=852 RepID=UPI001F397270|nr:iron-containing alcohol dehydrogenase [Fusobacterium perfoetens]MCF2613108.1 iron-containing alcohol dehydrogenase [Fusobacterium perfoetens]